jgi:hypothetical protein
VKLRPTPRSWITPYIRDAFDPVGRQQDGELLEGQDRMTDSPKDG